MEHAVELAFAYAANFMIRKFHTTDIYIQRKVDRIKFAQMFVHFSDSILSPIVEMAYDYLKKDVTPSRKKERRGRVFNAELAASRPSEVDD